MSDTITNSMLAQKISDLILSWQTWIAQLSTWLAGTAGGGPNSDGTYPLQNNLGVITQVKCPAQMAADVTATIGGATTSATAAAASATSASTSATSAGTSATNAAASATAAAASAATAASSASDANAKSLAAGTAGAAAAQALYGTRINNTQSVAYTLVALDKGRTVKAPGWTVNAGVASPDDVVYLYNNSATPQTVTAGGGFTLRLGGSTTTGNRTLAAYTYATLYFHSASEAVLDGTGVS